MTVHKVHCMEKLYPTRDTPRSPERNGKSRLTVSGRKLRMARKAYRGLEIHIPRAGS